jgi:hypothetical protein
LKLPDGETVLPIFFQEEAGMFPWLEAVGEAWRIAEVPLGDFIALPCGPCAGWSVSFAISLPQRARKEGLSR